jgi:hypothetical protein
MTPGLSFGRSDMLGILPEEPQPSRREGGHYTLLTEACRVLVANIDTATSTVELVWSVIGAIAHRGWSGGPPQWRERNDESSMPRTLAWGTSVLLSTRNEGLSGHRVIAAWGCWGNATGSTSVATWRRQAWRLPVSSRVLLVSRSTSPPEGQLAVLGGCYFGNAYLSLSNAGRTSRGPSAQTPRSYLGRNLQPKACRCAR